MLRSFISSLKSTIQNKRFTSSNDVSSTPATYSKGMAIFHWAMAFGVSSCVGTVLYAQSLDKNDKNKGKIMRIHKSMGLFVATLIVPRIALRLVSKLPPKLPASNAQHMAADFVHYLLYGSVLTLTSSGIIMGYYSGYGVPFFWADKMIPGASAENKNSSISNNAYNIHSYTGKALEYIVPVHVGAVGVNMLQGNRILARMWPF